MKQSSYILTIDNGTQSLRAIVFDFEGNIVAKVKQEIEPYFSKEPGWAEQNAELYWNTLCDVCQRVLQDPQVVAGKIVGVALTTQRGTVVNLDEKGEPLRPAITWLDQRQLDKPKKLGGIWEYLIRMMGEKETLDYFMGQAESNWICEQQPDVWEKTKKFVLLSGYLSYKLTDNFVDSTACQVGYVPFDYKKQQWAGPRDWKWRATAITRDMLPELKAPGELLGKITADAARATGIPAGLPVISAGADKACEIIGSGCINPRMGAISYGTTATINTTSQRYIEAVPLIPPYPSAVPGSYCTEIQIFRGFWMVNWFKNQLGLREEKIAEERGIPTEAVLDEIIADIPPGSMGLTLQPYWSPGVRVPGLEAKGAIVGFGDVHTRAHIYRAILEGIAYALREGKERIEKRSGVKLQKLRVSGGGSQSDVAMQITADVFGLPAERPHTFETSGLGAAIDAAVGLGHYNNFPEAIQHMTRVGDVFTPNADAVKVYDRLYQEVYQHMYSQLGGIYKSIKKITGYPS